MYYKKVKIKLEREKEMKFIYNIILFFIISIYTYSHPHVFFDANIDVKIENQKLQGIELQLNLDELNTRLNRKILKPDKEMNVEQENIVFLKNLFKDKPKQNVVIINDWKKDQNGCLKLRTENLAIELIAKNNLNHSSKEKFINVFGEPNEKRFINDTEVLVYYFDTLCDAQEQDKCYAEFYFKSGLLTSTEFLCE